MLVLTSWMKMSALDSMENSEAFLGAELRTAQYSPVHLMVANTRVCPLISAVM